MKDKDVAIIMKLALEFNANIVALAAAYYGNMDKRNAKRFYREFNKLSSIYNNQLKKIGDKYEEA